jgi:hypothetical protein
LGLGVGGVQNRAKGGSTAHDLGLEEGGTDEDDDPDI